MRSGLVAAAAALAVTAGCASSATTGTPARSAPSTSPPAPTAPASSPAVTEPSVRAVLTPWHLPGPVSRSVALETGGHTLLAGGLQPGDHSTDQVLAVDPEQGSVRTAGRLAQAVHDAAGGVVGGKPFVFGGGGATEMDTVQGTPGGPWRVVGHLPGGTRSDLSVASVGDALLLIGGYDGSQTPTAILRTTDGTHFTEAGRLPSGARYAGVATIGDTVWVLGGEVGQRELSEVYRIDAATGRVTSAGRLPGPLGHEAVIPVGDRLLVAGGRTAVHRTTSAMWWFDTASHRWSRAGRLPEPVADAPAVVHGNHAWLLGGEAPDFTAAVVELSWG